MVAIFALIGETLLQPSRHPFSASTLGLCQSLCGLSEFVWMGNFLACRERQEMQKAGINAYRSCPNHRNTVRLCVDAQAQIPARGMLDDTATLEPSRRQSLRVEADRADAWHMDTCSSRRFERIRKRDTAEPIARAFELGFPGQLLRTALPGHPRRIQHTLQGMTRDTKLFAVISQEIMEGFLAVIDTVFGVCFYLAYGPIPHTSKMPQPRIKLVCLRVVEPKLELPLDHLIPVSDSRCIA